jgi:hypothetical protein
LAVAKTKLKPKLLYVKTKVSALRQRLKSCRATWRGEVNCKICCRASERKTRRASEKQFAQNIKIVLYIVRTLCEYISSERGQ